MTRATGDMSQAAVSLDTDALLRFLLFMTAVMGVKAITAAVSVLMLERYAGKTEYRFRDNFVRHFLSLPYAVFEKKNAGAMLSIYSNDIPEAAKYASGVTLSVISAFITLLASFVYMLIINPLYTIIFYAMFPVFIFIQVLVSKPIQKLSIERSVERANFNAVVNDSLQNISTVVAYSLEDIMEERYMTAYNKFYIVVRRYILTGLRLLISGIIATVLPQLFITAVAGISVIDGNMTLAEFVVFTTLASTAGNWLTMLSQVLRDVKTAAGGAARLMDNTDGAIEDPDTGETITAEDDTAIAFDKVSFSYGGDNGTLALRDVSFEVKKGGKTAIVGGSGSGKSTVFKLLLGLYEPLSGNISVSGHDMKKLSKTALRGHFSYVPQDSFMFPESIGENIACAKPGTPELMSKMQKVCKDAGVMDFIESLPCGFDTVLAESAENVSGGQKQRLAIARAFYNDAPVVLFDEATSALDPVTEQAILETMDTLMQGRTLVMVSHRLKAAQNCGRIVVMDGGEVAGIGSHEELLKSCAAYSALHNAQGGEL